MSDDAKIIFSKNPPVAPESKAGDLVQIRQHESLSQETKAASANALQPAESDHWIYARVLEPLPDGKLRVRVEHPANREHGAEKIVAPDDYRTKEHLAGIVEQTRKLAELRPSTQNNLLAKHFAAQHERLSASEA